jgi:hypothetical protein
VAISVAAMKIGSPSVMASIIFRFDRGHIQLMIQGIHDLDDADSFPRYFFSFKEADAHTRAFLKWRLWKKRAFPHTLDVSTQELFLMPKSPQSTA